MIYRSNGLRAALSIFTFASGAVAFSAIAIGALAFGTAAHAQSDEPDHLLLLAFGNVAKNAIKVLPQNQRAIAFKLICKRDVGVAFGDENFPSVGIRHMIQIPDRSADFPVLAREYRQAPALGK